jgi:dTDP-4-dehydrorhamnose reductase
MKILVTGAGGQLSSELEQLSAEFPSHQFFIYAVNDLDITNAAAVEKAFSELKPDACINAAAYTAVDKAEQENEIAFAVNADGTAHLAKACFENNARLIHISTDYVFDGTSQTPYKPTDKTSPVNVYGASKLKGEELAMEENQGTVIIRTSWVYSSYGNNFVKTMIRLMQQKPELNIVSDQQGCPTYAADLAAAIMQIIEAKEWTPGIYHYSNEGVTTWYEFAKAIAEHCKFNCKVSPISTEQYPTPAARPKYSVMDTSLIKEIYGLQIRNWKIALEECLDLLGCR